MKGLFVGTFDPITVGHIDVIKRASRVFDKVIVGVSDNINKKCMFSLEERTMLIKEQLGALVEVVSYDSLTTELAKGMGDVCLVRGVRDGNDCQYENNLYFVNQKLFEELDTIYFPSKQENLHVSSSFVRELVKYGGDYSSMVGEKTYYTMKKILAEKK